MKNSAQMAPINSTPKNRKDKDLSPLGINFIYPLVVIVTALLASCNNQPGLSGTIKMNNDGIWAPKTYLIDPITFNGISTSFLGKVIDSAIIGKDGSFGFDEMPQTIEPVLLQIAIQQKGERYANKLEMENMEVANYFPIVWKSGKRIEIATTANHFQKDLSIKDASPENEAMLLLRNVRQNAYQMYLGQIEGLAHDESNLIEMEKAYVEFQVPLMKFAEETPYLLPALMASRWVSLEGNYERTPEFIFGQCQKWKDVYAHHDWVKQLCSIGDRDVLPVLSGDLIPDFPLPMLSGDTLSLNSLLTSKKLTLLDLWASWCMPCRAENRDYLVPLWEKYQQEGFQIIGYALDASKQVWSKAIEKDGASRWLNTSHLHGDDAPLFKALRMVTIPANFLINDQGKVVAKNLHGEDLVQFVDGFMENY